MMGLEMLGYGVWTQGRFYNQIVVVICDICTWLFTMQQHLYIWKLTSVCDSWTYASSVVCEILVHVSLRDSWAQNQEEHHPQEHFDTVVKENNQL